MSMPDDQRPDDPLLEQLHKLHAAFDAKVRYDEVRERHFESMSKELAAHRQGLYQAPVRTILLDLAAMYDDLTNAINSAADCPETAEALAFFRGTVEQILARNGVARFSVDDTMVDRTRQKVISVVETSDPSTDRRVAVRLRPGFTWDDRMLRPEWVSVYVTRAMPQARPSDEVNDHTADSADTLQVATQANEGALS